MENERLEFMKHVAGEAGKIIMGYWGTDVRAHFKDDNSVVTEADLRVSEFVQRAFTDRFPNDGLLTEESEDSNERLSREGVFVVDELDGSGDFKRKEEDFCFLCAYVEKGTPTIGVVYEPQKKRMFFAQRNQGAYITQGTDTIRLSPLASTTWENSLVGHPKNYKGDKYSRLYTLMGIPEDRLVCSGSMGTRMMQVAFGQTHMILGYTQSLKEWDIAAGHVILEARGINVSDISGNPLIYNKQTPKTENGILVVHPDIKAATLEKLIGCRDKLEM